MKLGYNPHALSGPRAIVGVIVMGAILPTVIFLLLGMSTVSQFFTIAASTFLAWGVGDLLSTILEKPRLKDRSPVRSLREELDRREKE